LLRKSFPFIVTPGWKELLPLVKINQALVKINQELVKINQSNEQNQT
jgi:hypothetical protein